jgi:hypothetical protein
MKNKINKLSIDGEDINLKKDFLGWHIVYPWKNDDGSINWFNFLTGGSWIKLIIVIVFVLLIVGAIYEYTSNINALLSCFEDPIILEECKRIFGNPNMTIG